MKPQAMPTPLTPNVKDLMVGAMLRKRRNSLKLSLAEVETTTKIRGKYLVSLEACDYEALPNDIYTRGFVQSYADFLGLDGATVAMQYQNERGSKPKPTAPKPSKRAKRKRFFVTPKLIAVFLSLVGAFAVVGYLSWQFQGLSAAPRLTVTSPLADQLINGSVTDITGSVAGGSDVFVNDSPILVDANGNFKEKLALQDGTNIIRVTAKNRLGKVTLITRNVVAKIAKIDSPALIPGAPATIDGVQVEVSIRGAAAAVTVEVDGKQEFVGTMVDGITRVFKGANKIKISTNNAGATSLKITNSIAADKVLGPLGRDGETKRDLEFAKDTVIQ